MDPRTRTSVPKAVPGEDPGRRLRTLIILHLAEHPRATGPQIRQALGVAEDDLAASRAVADELYRMADGGQIDPRNVGGLIGWEIRCVAPGLADPVTDIWTVTTRDGEQLARVRGSDNDEAARAARGIYAVRQYEDTAGGFALRRLRHSEAGPAADDD